MSGPMADHYGVVTTDTGTPDVGKDADPRHTVGAEMHAVEVGVETEVHAVEAEVEAVAAEVEAEVEAEARHIIGEVGDEIRFTFSERRGWLVGVAFNIVIAGVWIGYTHYQPHSHDRVRIAGLATGVALWVLADVINTNQLGADADRVARKLEKGRGVVHELILKNGALVFLLLPLTVCISVVARLLVDRWRDIPDAVLLDLFVVFIWLGIGDVLSVLLPYRPISLRDRWHARHTWPRWLVCLAAPYLALFAIRWLNWPLRELRIHRVFGSADRNFTPYVLTCLAYGLAVWVLALAVVSVYSRVKEERLDRDLHRSG